MLNEFFLDLDLFKKNINSKTRLELFNEVGKILISKNYVKNSYIENIIERENIYPTGIMTSYCPVAMPHIDAKYSNVNTLFVITSEKGIEFEDAEEDKNLYAKIIFGLIVKNHDEHIDFLVKISSIIQNVDLLENLYNAKNETEMKNLIEKHLI